MANLDLTGYHLSFDAEMSSPADMSQFANTFINGDRTLYTNYEDEEYVDNNPANPANPFSFADGALTITAQPVAAGGHSYTSGTIQTFNSFSQNQGYFEVRAQTPLKQGFWSAFWMIPTTSYPEIDVLEQPSNLSTSARYWTQINTPTDYSGGWQETGTDLSAGYHSYGFLWTANTIQFSFDGELIGYPHATPASLNDVQMFMIANLAVGTSYAWPGAPVDGATAQYKIDYIRAFSMDPLVPTVELQPISSPDGVDTTPVGAITAPAALATPQTIGIGVNAVSYDGSMVAITPSALLSNGPESFIQPGAADTLTVSLAEDAWQGDAQAAISIDGNVLGTVTVTAAYASATPDLFTFTGNFGLGAHVLGVNFLNEAYAGPGADRNLFVKGATFDGVTVPSAEASLFTNGLVNFAIPAHS